MYNFIGKRVSGWVHIESRETWKLCLKNNQQMIIYVTINLKRG